MRPRLTASLVIYNCPESSFLSAATSFLNSGGHLVISDNSDERLESQLLGHPRVEYLFNGRNLGFGAAHNRAIDLIRNKSDFHLVLNPDVCFEPVAMEHLLSVIGGDPNIGAIMPRINYPDGALQRLTKLLPTPLDLILRRFIPIRQLRLAINRRYELHALPQTGLIEVPTLSGCFLLVRTALFERIGSFDERYFMYLEDVDLVRRLASVSKVCYDPTVSIVHAYAKGSYRNRRLLRYHTVSAIKYFNKWGWFSDPVRVKRNCEMLGSLEDGDSVR